MNSSVKTVEWHLIGSPEHVLETGLVGEHLWAISLVTNIVPCKGNSTRLA